MMLRWAPVKSQVRPCKQSPSHSAWRKVRHPINSHCWHEPSLSLTIHVSSLGKCWPVVAATNAQHILRTVKKLRETVELAVVEVNWRLVDAIQRGLAGVGASQQGAQHCPTGRPVSFAPDVQDLAVPLHHVCEAHGQARIQKWIVGTQTCLLAQQPITGTKTHRTYHCCTQPTRRTA